jgi:hypothetical protein
MDCTASDPRERHYRKFRREMLLIRQIVLADKAQQSDSDRAALEAKLRKLTVARARRNRPLRPWGTSFGTPSAS